MAEVPGPQFQPEPEVRHLCEQLRALKRRTGLSYAALAAETGFSKSSWERYLNGKTLPPREAVAALARLGGEQPAMLVALWELAERAWRARDAAPVSPPPDPSPEPEPAPASSPPSSESAPPPGPARRRRRPRTGVLAGAAVAATVGLLATLGYVVHDPESSPVASSNPTSGPGASASPTGSCQGVSCTGGDPNVLCWYNARTLATRDAGGGRTVELRASDRCQAVWARLADARPGDVVWVETSDGRREPVESAANASVFTMMVGVDDPAELTRARACATLADGTERCTR
ncbi:helix-turn-helix domain-containing protein [Streptomyces sp. 4N509B]|uniref:helix-turn-helix domain-containing protein n=1 Tax=Streptomyces sp. 4N509B TaxID=3457413 RepID=UPI003FD0197E